MPLAADADPFVTWWATDRDNNGPAPTPEQIKAGRRGGLSRRTRRHRWRPAMNATLNTHLIDLPHLSEPGQVTWPVIAAGGVALLIARRGGDGRGVG